MKAVKYIGYQALLGLFIIFLSSCNLPQKAAPGQDQNLAQTVEALNTIVVQQKNVVATQAQAAPPAPPAQPPQAPPAAPNPTAMPSATLEFTPTTIPHTLRPAQPGWVSRWFIDANSSLTASEKRAPGGDYYPKNIYERPFTANDMNYRPDLDINKAEISQDSNFIYVTIYLNGTNPQGGGLQGNYGVELDTSLNGRGKYLILVSNPSGSDWKMENVTAYKDSGSKVGGARPMLSDAPADYAGYDQIIFGLQNLADPDAAWGRVSPKGSSIVEIAFKRSLIGGANIFLWNVWADDGPKDPKKFDYNDHFTASDAGSPYNNDSNYPLKALALVDNTCREIFNFTPTADIPGLCAPPATATPIPPTHTPKPPEVKPGKVIGMVFADNNNNGHKDPGDGPWCNGVTVNVSAGACSGGTGMVLDVSCNFSSPPLDPGHYCVYAAGWTFTTPSHVNITIPSGGTVSVLFGTYVVP